MHGNNQRFNNKRKKPRRRPWGATASLSEKIAETGGQTGFALEIDPTAAPPIVTRGQETTRVAAGIFGQRTEPSAASSVRQTRLFFQSPTPRGGNATTPVEKPSTGSRRSRFSRASTKIPGRTSTTAVHVVCAISENLARETCVSSLDAGSPTTMQVGHSLWIATPRPCFYLKCGFS